MWKTVLALLVTIIVIPFIAFRFDDPLTALQSSTLVKVVYIYMVAAIFCFIVSTLAGNYSQVDKLWSIMPLAYTWVVAWESGFEPRLVLMAFLVSLWGIRLTYNFSRRGGYSIRFWTGEEDYRWAVLRAKPEFAAKWKWMLFNFLFISLYQMGLILLMTLPAVRSMGGGPITYVDGILAFLLIAFIIIETVADQQQWNFHKQKGLLREKGELLPENYAKGFIDTGSLGSGSPPQLCSRAGHLDCFLFFQRGSHRALDQLVDHGSHPAGSALLGKQQFQ